MPDQFSEFSFDQTQFSLEEPMREGLAQLPQEKKPVDNTPKVPLYKRKKFIIAAIAGTIFLVVLILIVVNTLIMRSRRPIAPDVSPLPTNGNAISHPIEGKITGLEEELETYDENQATLVLPAVDYSISIDKVEKR
jgi:hypothetical protein